MVTVYFVIFGSEVNSLDNSMNNQFINPKTFQQESELTKKKYTQKK